MKQSKKHYLTKIGIIIGAISPATLVASSSDTKSTNAESTLESVIQNLDAAPFASLIQTTGGSPSNLASSISEADVIGKLKLASSFTSLSEAEKTKLSDSDVTISSKNDLGVLEITIENHGAQKVILVHGFKLENVDPTIKFLIKWLNKEWVYYKNGIGTLLPSELANTSYSDSQWRDIFESFFDRVISSKQKQIDSEGLTTKQLNDAKLKVATNVNYYITAIKAYDSFGILSLTVKYEKEVKQINISNFKSQKDKLLPSEINKKHLQLYLWTINGWSNKKRKAVTEDLITITKRDEDLGKLEFNIPLIDKKGVYDASSRRRHKYTISGLKTNAKVLANAIQGLAENALDGNGDDTKLPSAITSTDVFTWIKALATINSLNDDQKAFLVEGDIGLTNDDNAGTLEVTINGHGDAKTLKISGFKTNAKVLANAIQDLAKNAFDGNGDDTKLPSAITSTDVFDWIKALATINILNNAQKALLIEGNIALTDDDNAGTLKVTINGHGNAKEFNPISGFKTNAQAEAEGKIATDKAQFTSFTQTLDDGVNRLEDGPVSKATLEGLSGHNSLPVAIDSVARTFSITTDPSGQATVTITFTSGEFKDTANYEINNFKTAAQTADEKALIDAIKSLASNALNRLSDAAKLPSEIESKAVYDALKGLVAISNLSPEQQALLVEGDITLTPKNSEGNLDVTIDNHGEAKTLIISGFKTTTKKAIETDKALFASFGETLTKAVDRINDGDVDKDALENLEGHRNFPAETSGVTRTFIINTDQDGLATVTVTFTSGEDRDTVNYKITGFKTTAQVEAEEKIAIDKAQFDSFTQTLDAKVNRLNNGNVNKETLEGLSGHKSLPAETTGVTRTYNINTNPTGQATVTITFTSGEFKDTANYEINNFKTAAQTADEKALIDAIKSLASNALNRLSDAAKLPSEIESKAVYDALKGLVAISNLSPEQQALLVEGDITLTPKNSEGNLDVTIDNHGEAKTLIISGFKTTTKKAIETDKALFASFGETLTKAADRINDGDVDKDALENLEGHRNFPAETSGVTRTFIINTDPDGLATVTVTFTSGEDRDTVNYKITGFKTTAQVEAEEKIAIDKAQFDSFTQTLDAKVNRLNNGNVNKETLEGLSGHKSLPAETTGVTRTYNINTNPAGQATVTITFTSGEFKDTANYEINNFKTAAQTADEKALIDAIKSLASNALNRLSDAAKLPSEIERKAVYDALKGLVAISNLSPEQQALLVEGDITLTPKNSEGNLDVIIDNHGEAKTLIISGFKTTTKKAIETDKALFASFGETLTKAADRINDGDVDKDALENLEGHRNFPAETSGVTRTFIINTDPDGLATVTVTFTSGEDRDTVNYKITGFKTTAQVEAEEKIAIDKAQFDSFTQTLDAKVNRLNNGNVNKETLEGLSGHKSLPAETTGVTRTYNINTNPAGQATVTITFTSGEFKDTANYEINNFKTAAQTADEKALIDAIKSLASNALNRLSDAAKLPSEIERKAVYDALKGLVAISNLSPEQQALLVEGDITLTPKNSEGNLDVIIDNHGEAKTLIISGFKTTTKKAIETDKALFASFGETLTKAADRINDGDVDKDALENLEGHRNFPAETSGVTRTFIINTDPDGLATVTVTFTSGEDRDTVNYKITGFKTTAQVEAEEKIAIDKAQFDSFTQTLDAKVNRLNNGNVNKETLEGLSGHKSLPAETTGVTRTYNINTNPAGQATVTITFTSGEFKDTANYEINNFKTAAQTADEKALIDAIKSLASNALNRLSDAAKLPSEIESKAVYDALKGLVAISNLSPEQQALLVEGDITLTPKNSEGNLDVIIDNHGEAKTLIISGFKTTTKKAIETDKALFASFGETLTKAADRINDGDVDKDALENLEGHRNFPAETSGVTRTFIINTDPDGLATVTVTFTSGEDRDTVNYKITGFKTTAQVEAEEKIAIDKAQFDSFTQTLDAKVNRLNNGNVNKETLEGLSGHKSLPAETTGVTRTYNINTNPAGQATVTITFTSGEFKDTANYEINNFKTAAQTADEKALIDAIKSLASNALNRLSDAAKLPSEIERKAVYDALKGLVAISNLSPEQQALLVEGDITLTPKNSEGNLDVTIDNHGEAKTLIISGFKTTTKKAIETDKALFASFGETLTKAADRINDGDVDKDALENLEGHRNFPAETSGVTRTFIINTDPDGLATVTVTFTSGEDRDTVNYKITGFKTTAQVEAEEKIAIDKAQFDSFTQTLDAKVNRLNNGNINKETLEGLSGHKSLPAETTGVTRTYNINTNPAGQATVTITFTSGEFKDTANYEINNFKTAAQTADEKALIDAIKSLASNALNRLSDAAKLPSEIERKAVYDALKGLVAISNLSPEQQALLVEGDITLTPKNSEGNLDVTIDNHGEAKTLIISGFKTTTKKAIETDKALFASFGETLTRAADRINDGDVDKDALENLEGHRNFPAETSGVTRTFIINTDPDGLATVTVTFTSGEDRDTVNYKITGFKTTAQVEAEEKIAIDKAQFDSFTQTLDAKVNRLNNGNVNKETLEGLSGHKSLPAETTGVTRTYNINTNPAGQATVTITFTSGEFKDTANYEINNFKTADEKALIDAIKSLASNALNGLANANTLPGYINAKAVFDHIKTLPAITTLSIAQQALLLEGDIKLAANNGEGTLEVTINNHGEAKTFTISGFQTEAEANVVAANNAIDALTVSSITAPTKKTTVAFGDTPKDVNFNPPSLAGYTFTFIGATSVSASGTSDATYSVTKEGVDGAKTRELLFRGVDGFQTEAEANVVAANNAIDALTVSSITAPTKKTTVAFGDTPEDVNFNPPSLSGYTFTFIGATSVSAIGTSDATYSVTKEGVDGAKTRELLFRGVDGFQTEAEANKVETSKVVQGLAEGALDGKGDGTKLPSEITETSVLGWIKALATINSLTKDQKALLIEGNIALTHDDSAGTLIVTINGHGNAKEFNPISGFKTTAQVEAEEKIATDKAQFDGFTQTLTEAADRINDGNVDKETLERLSGHNSLPVAIADVTRTYNINTNRAGQAIVTVTFTSDGFSDKTNYEINNFKTADQTADEKALIDAIKSLGNNALDDLSNAAKLPNEINRKAIFDALKALSAISKLSANQKALLSEDDILLAADNGAGNLEITINNHGEAKTLTISGFKTNNKALEDAIQGLAGDALASNGDASKLPSAITSKIVLGWIKALATIGDLTNDQKALLIEGNIALTDDDNAGTLEVIINDHGMAKSFTTIDGFQTIAKKAIETDKAKFSDITPTLDDRVNRLEDGLVSKETLEGLGGHGLLPEATAGVTRTYNINTNQDGLATVTVTFVNGADRGTIDYEITGFKTTAQTNLEAINNAIQGLEEDALNGLANTNTFPGDINAKAVLDHIKTLAAISTLSNEQQALLLENDIQLIANNGNGNLRVTIARHGQDKIFAITGFKQDTGETLTSDSDDDSEGLSLPALIGIIAGSIVGLGLGGYLIYYLIKKRK